MAGVVAAGCSTVSDAAYEIGAGRLAHATASSLTVIDVAADHVAGWRACHMTRRPQGHCAATMPRPGAAVTSGV